MHFLVFYLIIFYPFRLETKSSLFNFSGDLTMLFIKTFLDVVISVANLATISVSEESSYLNSSGNLENGYVVIGKTVSGESLQLSDVFVDRTDAVTKRDYILNTQLSATVVNV